MAKATIDRGVQELLADGSERTRGDSSAGERHFRGWVPGPLFEWVKRVSLVELAIFAGLLVVWLAPGMERATFWFGLTHGIGYLVLCALIWVTVLRQQAPFWLFASVLTPVGPVGSSIGVAVIERREARRRSIGKAS